MTPVRAAAPPPSPESAAEPRRPASCDRRAADRFERALRDKARPCRDQEQPPDEAADEERETLLPAAAPPPSLPPSLPPHGALRHGATELAALAPAARATLDPSPTAARLAAPAPPPGDAPRRFEVSLGGLPLALQATMNAAEPGAAPRWSLAITSNSLNPAVLRRHSGRLDERLRLKALSSDPVRIHDDEDPHD